MNNNNNNQCNCNCNPGNPEIGGQNINMAVCEKNIQMLPMLQTYNTVVLKPNICCKKNILTQQMLSCEDTKYVIRWDFDLNGQTITVSERCILEFDGGSLKNGTIVGQDTVFINVGDVEIWGENLIKEGTWREISGTGGGGIPDKDYDPEHYSGLGRKTLKLKEGSNILTQEDFSSDNTVYIISYDFVLGENITVPANSVLEFDGGSIDVGEGENKKTITGNNSVIGAGLDKIFGIDIELAGSWIIEYAHPEWWGAKGDGVNDDTDAFYAALHNFSSIFLRGRYSIDFRDISLSNKAIAGKWRTSSGIIQRNSNVPFALVKTYNKLTNFTFFAQNNTEQTDILHFGYANGTYNSFAFTDITNMVFVGKTDDVGNIQLEDYTIPLHFNIREGGNSDIFVENVRMYHCLIGLWFQFEELPGTKLQWITECTFKDITVYNPKLYGLKWDAISMRHQGWTIDGEVHQTMWCYDNRFENIGIDLVRDGSTGFYLGQGMGSVINSIVFNDIKPDDQGLVGYAVEFAPIDSPLRHKMFTEIVGGHWEGRIKNMDYAYMNIIRNVGLSLRDSKESLNTYDTLDVSNLKNVVDVNILGNNFLNYFTMTNAHFSVGKDEFGEYIRVQRISEDATFGITLGLSRNYLNSVGVTNGIYTIQAVVESNLGRNSSGFSVGGNHGYDVVYQVINAGKTYEAYTYQDLKIIGTNFIKLTDENQSSVTINFGGPARGTTTGDIINDIKIYDIKFLRGIVGYYLGYFQTQHETPNIQIRQSLTASGRTLAFTLGFKSAYDLYGSARPLPNYVRITGALPEINKYETLQLGNILKYKPSSQLSIPIYGTYGGEKATCIISTNGDVSIKAETQIADETYIVGLYGNVEEVIDAFRWDGENEYIYRFPKAVAKDGTPVGDVNLVDRDVYAGVNTYTDVLNFNIFHSTRFGLATMNQGNLQVKFDTSHIQLQKAMTKAELADKVLLKNNIIFESGQQVFITDEGTNGALCTLFYSKPDITTWINSRYTDDTVIIQEDDTIELYFLGKVVKVDVHTGDTVLNVFSAIRDEALNIFDNELVADITTPISQQSTTKWYIGQIVIKNDNPNSSVIYIKYVNKDGIYNFSKGIYVLHSVNDIGLSVKTCLDSGQDFKVVKASGELVDKFWT